MGIVGGVQEIRGPSEWNALRTALPEGAEAHAREVMPRLVTLAGLALDFGRVERATAHQDGVRPETDAEHTIMLQVVAAELAEAHNRSAAWTQRLNIMHVVTHALVHDFAEVFSGDTNTLGASAASLAAKEEREARARARLVEVAGADSFLIHALRRYEAQDTVEAVFVRLVDKVLPKLTHTFNRAAAARRSVPSFEHFVEAHAAQFRDWSAKIARWRSTTERNAALQLALAALLVSCEDAERAWLAGDPGQTSTPAAL